jgi:5-methyltetrahydrofolate--homocysteine methyltransferase
MSSGGLRVGYSPRPPSGQPRNEAIADLAVRSVAYLEPYLAKERATGRGQGKVVLATVKGDVHDIGKNIVGVVLGCNNYEVIDLGVMVPAAKILDTAVAEGADAVGLSGLITPSLDEMVTVATEMRHRGLRLPLLIGGATTSKQHTAVRIAPAYDGPTVHVLDASRGRRCGVRPARPGPRAGAGRGQPGRPAAAARPAREPVRPAAAHPRPGARQPGAGRLRRPAGTGVHRRPDCRASPGELRELVDWQFLFLAWELKGKYPAILAQPVARELYDDANDLLDQIVADGSLTARGAYAFRPAHSEGDDLVLDSGLRLPMLRQQTTKPDGRANRCLADYLAPAGDHLGGFAVAIPGAEALAVRYEAEHDDYRAIMAKALADRLAEAFAEWVHLRARREWFEPDALPTVEDLHAERFRGIRPALGYPASPDHSEKRDLFDLLGARALGIGLTSSYAMTPAASVSGLIFAHPASRYFTVGRIGRDQAEEYATRRGTSLAEVEHWLRPNLGYEP